MIFKSKKDKLTAFIVLGLFLWMECSLCSFENIKDSLIFGLNLYCC